MVNDILTAMQHERCCTRVLYNDYLRKYEIATLKRALYKLERQGTIAKTPNPEGGWYIIGRRKPKRGWMERYL